MASDFLKSSGSFISAITEKNAGTPPYAKISDPMLEIAV